MLRRQEGLQQEFRPVETTRGHLFNLEADADQRLCIRTNRNNNNNTCR
jgi:hypothetical protein